MSKRQLNVQYRSVHFRRLRSAVLFRFGALALIIMMLNSFVPMSIHAFSATTMQLILYAGEKHAYINKQPVELDVPAQIVKGRMYVPLKFLGDSLGFPVKWDKETQLISVETNKASVLISEQDNIVWMNGSAQPLSNIGFIDEGRLLVQLTWFSGLTDAETVYNAELNRVEVTYVKQPIGIAKHTPVAKFALGKPIYRIGEPVQYIDLSYHPDAKGIVARQWKGRQEAFFTPGKHSVQLTVVDRDGTESAPFTKDVVVVDEPYFTELEFQLHHNPVESFVKTDRGTFNYNVPVLSKNVRHEKSRKLLVSNSPETFKELGILYQDRVNGKARLYATHINGMNESARFYIVATNHSRRTVQIKTTNKGEVAPSAYAHLIGHIATIDYLIREPEQDTLDIRPGETRVYKTMADFHPGQGVNLIYDIETTGEVEFTFLVTEPSDTNGWTNLRQYRKLPYERHVRGTYDVSDIHWSIDGSSIRRPSRLIIGDNSSDVFIKGFDPLRGHAVDNYGNYGVIYKIEVRNPEKMAILLAARGGSFSGPFKINDHFVRAPRSGVITPFDGAFLLARTTGHEDKLTIEFSPPSGSSFPADLIFYPLDEDK